jgi:radical SAM superfamily enzyme YgiQ (UPF0313 family)
MKQKIYYIQPTYRDSNGKLFKGKSLHVHSLAIPALSAATPDGWEKEISIEYFEDLNFNSDAPVIAITSMGYDIVRGIEIADEFRNRGKLVIFGGYQSNFSSSYLSDHCNSIIHGNPGKRYMSIILNDAVMNRLKREYYCGIDVNFPFDYSILARRKITFTPVLSSVGCANNCDFCCTASIYKGCYRLRKIEYVIKDLLTINKFSRKAGFVDNNIYNNREYLMLLLRNMNERKISLLWGAQATINIGDDKEVLYLLHKSGCRVLFIGMESINQKNLDSVNKNFTAQEYSKKIKNIHDAGIKVASYFMFGLENDSKDTVNDIFRFINSTGIEIPLLNFLTPAPGTRIYDRLKSEGRLLFHDDKELLSKKHYYNSACNTCFFIPRYMTPKEAEKYFLELNRKLAGYFQLIKRSVSFDPFMTAFLLGMNMVFRREYIAAKKKFFQQ